MERIENSNLVISSAAFENEGMIPSEYTCDGRGINPPLKIGNLPAGTKSIALIVEDPDAPNGTFDHWIQWDIPKTTTIRENSNPGTSGMNGKGKTGYYGPCPPSGIHRYYFHVYALDTLLRLEPGHNKQHLKNAMKSHILAEGSIMGKYTKAD
jgi:hypothetical protein